jgi:hypothetical protein
MPVNASLKLVKDALERDEVEMALSILSCADQQPELKAIWGYLLITGLRGVPRNIGKGTSLLYKNECFLAKLLMADIFANGRIRGPQDPEKAERYTREAITASPIETQIAAEGYPGGLAVYRDAVINAVIPGR